ENPHTFHRITARGCLTAEHDRVRLLEDGIGHVGDFGPGRNRIFNHRLEHVRRDDDRLPHSQTTLHDAPLDNWQFFHRTFDPEIAARDHDRVRRVDHFIDRADGGLVLDLRDDLRCAPEFFHESPEFLEIAFLPGKTQRHEIHSNLGAERHIVEVLLGERRQIHADAGKIDVAARTEHAGCKHFATDPVLLFRQDEKTHDTVVDQDNVANRNVVHESVIIYIDRIFLLALRAAHGELENVAGL